MAPDPQQLITITDPEVDRYATLRLIDWWDQDRVQAAYVMVVGAGALGNEVLKNLALLGVGHIFIVDFDTIEASNLTRSVLYRPQDGGLAKASVAAARVRAINPDVKTIAFTGDVTRELGLGVFRQMDLVIGCLDNRAARLAVNRACWRVNRPWVDGALDVQNGLMRVFAPHASACYECTLTDQDYMLLNLRYSCPPGFVVTAGRQPTTPMAASVIGALQVQEAMKLLHGQTVPVGNVVYFSGDTLRFTRMEYPRRDDCPAHHIYDLITELPYRVADLTIARLLADLHSRLADDSLHLHLPQEIVTRFYCAQCEREESVYQPYDTVIPDHVPCPQCGAARRFETTNALTYGDSDLNIPLSQLAIPPLHIFPAWSSTGWHYFELSGDSSDVLAWDLDGGRT